MSFEDRTELNKRKERIELNSHREIFLKKVLIEEMGRRKYVPENPTLMHRIGHRQPVKIERQKRVAKETGKKDQWTAWSEDHSV